MMDERDSGMIESKNFPVWRESIRNGYIRMHLLYALEETKVFDALRRADATGRTAGELAAECDLEPRILEGALDYLTFSDVVLTKTDGRYALSAQGRDWLGQDATLNMTYMMEAYAPLLEELLPALRRAQVYGRDFTRDGGLLAFASLKGTRGTYPWIVEKMRSLGVEIVADLGCGAGGLLTDFCQLDPGLRGVGVDRDPGAVEEARRQMRAHGLADRVRIVQGDLVNPATFATELQDAQAFNALGVVHEILGDGEQAVVQMFQRMKQLFPGRYFFLGEFNKLPDEDWAHIPPADRMKKLHYQHIMHPMSNQTLLPRAGWLALFERAGITCLEVNSFFVDEYVLQL